MRIASLVARPGIWQVRTMPFEPIEGWVIDTLTAVLYGVLALILLMLLRISGRLRRIIRLLEPGRDRTAGPSDRPIAPTDRYMREATRAEFERLHGKDGR
jgi:hypothetical protein